MFIVTSGDNLISFNCLVGESCASIATLTCDNAGELFVVYFFFLFYSFNVTEETTQSKKSLVFDLYG